MSDFLIIGGGIIGLLTARKLQQRGANVTLLEAQCLGQEASWAGGGIISPLYPWRYPDFITQLAKQSQSLYPALIQQLYEETGIDCELEKTGMLMLDAQEIIPAKAWALENRALMSVLEASEVTKQQNHLGIEKTALWMPEVMQVRNTRLLKALIASLIHAGVKLYQQQRVVKFTAKNQQLEHVQTVDKVFTADKIIIAAGAWSGGLLSLLPQSPMRAEVTVSPVKGQMLAIQAIPKLLNKMVLYHNHYLIPRKDGLVIVGSTIEYNAGFNKTPTQAARDELYQAAITLMPKLGEYPQVAQWAGLRPYCSRDVPLIERLAPYTNLYINAGHFRNGLVLAPASVDKMLEILQ